MDTMNINDPRFGTTCPACNAKPGERCTRPTDVTRRPVEWFHVSREPFEVSR